ncbi:MAG: DUF5011 domain-containing protein [Lachnospiraceae bacterium]|nr:DUF5011 domain-containing protein [Lachnospiraceae bacterium]
MRWLKGIVIAAFLICCGLFLCHYKGWFEKVDKRGPVISADTDMLELSVHDSEQSLLSGMTATDNIDGDVTNSLIVASQSLLNPDDHTRTITYAAFDKSNNVSIWQRKVKYTDYTPPVFSLTKPLVFNENDIYSVRDCVKAFDVIDGDITDKVKLVSGSNSFNAAGIFPVVFGVSNSCGDYSDIELMVEVKSTDKTTASKTPDVILREYLVYIKEGESFDAASYIKNIHSKVEGEVIETGSVIIDSAVDVNTPGKYTVTYSVVNSLGFAGESTLTVIVTE